MPRNLITTLAKSVSTNSYVTASDTKTTSDTRVSAGVAEADLIRNEVQSTI